MADDRDQIIYKQGRKAGLRDAANHARDRGRQEPSGHVASGLFELADHLDRLAALTFDNEPGGHGA